MDQLTHSAEKQKTQLFFELFSEVSYLANLMAQLLALQSPCRNFLTTGKDEFAGIALKITPTNDNGTPSHTLAMSCIFTPAPTPAVVLTIAFILTTIDSVAKYLAKDLQQILKNILEARVFSPALQSERPYEMQFKTQALKLNCKNTLIKYYIFCRQYEDYFDTASATGLNCVFFATTFVKK